MRALLATEVVSALVHCPGWRLHGEGAEIAIEKQWHFDSHLQSMLFVNSLGWLAERMNHHPEVLLKHRQCTVRWRTHDVGGLSRLDFEAAAQTDALTGEVA